MFFTEDLPIFLNAQEFATEALIRGRCIAGLESHAAVIANDVEATKMAFTCASRTVLDIAHGECITLRDRVYRIVGIQPDGTGLTALILEFLCTSP